MGKYYMFLLNATNNIIDPSFNNRNHNKKLLRCAKDNIFCLPQYGNALFMHETPIEDGPRHVFEAVLGDLHAASYGRPGTGELVFSS